MKEKAKRLNWRCHTRHLLEEILVNDQCAILRQPLKIFYGILREVAARAVVINDDELNSLMIRLTLFSCSDPSSEDYNKEIVAEVLAKIH